MKTEAVRYSNVWKTRNATAQSKVINNAPRTWLLRPNIKLAWANVIKTPEVNKSRVLAKGSPHGLTGVTPTGGQVPPIHILGDKL